MTGFMADATVENNGDSSWAALSTRLSLAMGSVVSAPSEEDVLTAKDANDFNPKWACKFETNLSNW